MIRGFLSFAANTNIYTLQMLSELTFANIALVYNGIIAANGQLCFEQTVLQQHTPANKFSERGKSILNEDFKNTVNNQIHESAYIRKNDYESLNSLILRTERTLISAGECVKLAMGAVNYAIVLQMAEMISAGTLALYLAIRNLQLSNLGETFYNLYDFSIISPGILLFATLSQGTNNQVCDSATTASK